MLKMKLNFLIIIVLLIILTISSVNANEISNLSNMSINEKSINDQFDYSTVKVTSFHDCEKVNNIDNNLSVGLIAINCSNEIPIKVNSSYGGDLVVLIDNKNSSSWTFNKSDSINIPIIHESNQDDKNRYISFIFSFEESWSYDCNVFFEESFLTFQFVPNNLNIFKQDSYKYDAVLNIIKKNNTLHILNLNNSLIEQNTIQFPICFSIDYFNITEVDYNEDLIRLIISNADGYFLNSTYDLFSIDINNNFMSIYLYVGDNKFNLTSYNLTLINLKDGASDTLVINIVNDMQSYINYTIDNQNVSFLIYIDKPYYDGYLVGNYNYENSVFYTERISENIKDVMNPVYFKFSLKNIKSGVYYIQFIYEFQYCEYFDDFKNIDVISFRINNTSQNFEEFICNVIISQNNVTLQLVKNFSLSYLMHFGEGNIFDEVLIELNSSANNSFYNSFGEIGDNPVKSGVANSKSSAKYYEISKKSISNHITNNVFEVLICIILFISMIIGFVKYKKNNFND